MVQQALADIRPTVLHPHVEVHFRARVVSAVVFDTITSAVIPL
jgi:hypothetical protein